MSNNATKAAAKRRLIRWRSGQTVRLNQGRSHFRCATCVHSKVKVRKAHESSLVRKRSELNLEFALLADGVAPADVYTVLATQEGQDRAFAKLD